MFLVDSVRRPFRLSRDFLEKKRKNFPRRAPVLLPGEAGGGLHLPPVIQPPRSTSRPKEKRVGARVLSERQALEGVGSCRKMEIFLHSRNFWNLREAIAEFIYSISALILSPPPDIPGKAHEEVQYKHSKSDSMALRASYQGLPPDVFKIRRLVFKEFAGRSESPPRYLARSLRRPHR